MDNIFSQNQSDFDCSTPIFKNKKNILTDKNQSQKKLKLQQLLTQDLQSTSFLSLSAMSKNVSHTPSIENPRKFNRSESWIYESLNEAEISFLKKKYSNNLSRDVINTVDEVEEKEFYTNSSSIIDDDYSFNALMDADKPNDVSISDISEQLVTPSFPENLKTNNVMVADWLANDGETYKEELIRKFRLRNSKIIISDNDEMAEANEAMNNRNSYHRIVTNSEQDESGSNIQRNMTVRSSIINRIEIERVDKLTKEIEAIEEYLKNKNVSEKRYQILLTKVKNYERELRTINVGKMNNEFYDNDQEYSTDGGYESFKDKRVIYQEMRRLIKHNNVLKEALAINKVTNELAKCDKMLFLNELKENDRLLNKYMQLAEAAVTDNQVLRIDKNRLSKLVADNSEILVYFFQNYIRKGHF